MTTKPLQIFFSTLEFSGDMHGAGLIREIKTLRPETVCYGLGGQQMATAGLELLTDTTSRSTIGFVEAIKNIRALKRLLREIVSGWETRRPDLVVWLDSGGFNLALAKEAKKRGIPVVCIFSPSAWAYGRDRAVKLAARVTRLLAVLPFEAEFYAQFGVNVTPIGHPLLDRVRPGVPPAIYREQLGLQPDEQLVALLPGSRKQEIDRLLGVMLESARVVNQTRKIRWVLPVAASLDRKWLEAKMAPYQVPVTLIESGVYDLLAAADLAVIASGTATLEAAILGTPLIVVYRISPLSLFIYRLLESPEHKGKQVLVGLPNLILGRMAAPELLQENLTPAHLTRELTGLLDNPVRRETLRRDLQTVRTLIGPPGVLARAAAEIVKIALSIREMS